MKNLSVLILLLTCPLVFAQTHNVKIPDSLHPKEIRVTRSESFIKTEILRIYFDPNSNLKFELFNKDQNGKVELINNQTLSKKDNYDEKLWLKIMMTDIQHIADYKDIQYKLKKNKAIIFLNNTWAIFYDTTISIDGVGYQIEVRGEERYNFVSYSNPEAFFKIYPEIDELKSVVDLLYLIRNEFKIWEE